MSALQPLTLWLPGGYWLPGAAGAGGKAGDYEGVKMQGVPAAPSSCKLSSSCLSGSQSPAFPLLPSLLLHEVQGTWGLWCRLAGNAGGGRRRWRLGYLAQLPASSHLGGPFCHLQLPGEDAAGPFWKLEAVIPLIISEPGKHRAPLTTPLQRRFYGRDSCTFLELSQGPGTAAGDASVLGRLHFSLADACHVSLCI